MAPRRVLLVSAAEDKYSQDAGEIVGQARDAFSALEAETRLEHARYEGGHSLTWERFDYIVHWLVTCAEAKL
jgi:hypothetical protein